MRKMLRCGGSPILNFKDLQNRFSPLALYAQLGAFHDFAAVHCIPLPSQLIDRESGGRYNVEYVTKQFWMQTLRRVEWPKKIETAEACLDFLLRDLLPAEEEDEDAQFRKVCRKGIEKEVSDARLYDKLRFIAGTGAGNDHKKAVLLLAISELAEMDVLKTGAGDWEEPHTPETGVLPSAQRAERRGHAGPILFPYDGTAYLTASSQPYKYWYHDEDTLAPGAEIQTVKIMAKTGSNQYAAVQIELYSTNTKQCLDRITLKTGEYRYCTVSQGRIIKFLPCVSASNDLRLVRPECDKPEIQVLASDVEAWTLNVENVSCFSAGETEKGFLFIQDGRVNFQFFKGAEDFFTRLTLEMIQLPAMEISITREGYEILLSNGTTVAEDPARKREGVLTLDPAGRYPIREENAGNAITL